MKSERFQKQRMNSKTRFLITAIIVLDLCFIYILYIFYALYIFFLQIGGMVLKWK